MYQYRHQVEYYETDKMRVTHHSNYIRFMEEARTHFLREIGWGYENFEDEGLVSPVVSVTCNYKKTTTYPDEIEIDLFLREMNGVRMKFSYEMRVKGEIVFTAESEHCFIDREGKLVNAKRRVLDFYQDLQKYIEKQ